MPEKSYTTHNENTAIEQDSDVIALAKKVRLARLNKELIEIENGTGNVDDVIRIKELIFEAFQNGFNPIGESINVSLDEIKKLCNGYAGEIASASMSLSDKIKAFDIKEIELESRENKLITNESEYKERQSILDEREKKIAIAEADYLLKNGTLEKRAIAIEGKLIEEKEQIKQLNALKEAISEFKLNYANHSGLASLVRKYFEGYYVDKCAKCKVLLS